jgi:hypothetical protein
MNGKGFSWSCANVQIFKIFFFFCGTGVWTQGHTFPQASPELLPEAFFEIRSRELFAQSWLWTAILLIFVSCAARIIGMSHQLRLINFKLQKWYMPKIKQNISPSQDSPN